MTKKLILHLFPYSDVLIFSLCVSSSSPPVLFYFVSALFFSFSSVLFLPSDIQTLPRVYFFDSYASLQTNGSDGSRFILPCLSLSLISLLLYCVYCVHLDLHHLSSFPFFIFSGCAQGVCMYVYCVLC